LQITDLIRETVKKSNEELYPLPLLIKKRVPQFDSENNKELSVFVSNKNVTTQLSYWFLAI
jgi:hypothetical protein